MNPSSGTNYAIGATVAALVVFAASFMPWGEIQAAPKLDIAGGTLPFPDNPSAE